MRQSAFCPANVNVPAAALTKGVQSGGVAQSSGTCTNKSAGAFSGAALASQSLGNLASTTTQLETTTASRALAGRRSEAENVCAPDQRKVDGVCVSNGQPAPVVYKPMVKQRAKTIFVKKVVVKKFAQATGPAGTREVKKVRVVVRRKVVRPAIVEETPEVVQQPGIFYDGTRYGVLDSGIRRLRAPDRVAGDDLPVL